MPLRAYIDNQEIISIEQTDEQWNTLKKRLKTKESVLILPCCKQEGYLRKSRKGLKHFVHSKSDNTCNWKPESSDHLQAKAEIVEACRKSGWEAIPEFSEANWTADVLAIQNGKRIAFEVQWSKQTFEETKFRQDRYRESNVRGCWFFRTIPKEMKNIDKKPIANKEIPAFKIFKDENENMIAQVEHRQMSLKTLVQCLLTRKLKFCEHIRLKPRQKVTIVFFETLCWKCKKPQHLYTVKQNFSTICGQDFHLDGSTWDSDDIDKHPQVYKAVKQFLNTDSGKHLKVGELKERYSHTVGHTYLSHGCYYCDIIFGDFHLQHLKSKCQYDPNALSHVVEIDLGTIVDEEKHWCYSECGEFCE